MEQSNLVKHTCIHSVLLGQATHTNGIFPRKTQWLGLKFGASPLKMCWLRVPTVPFRFWQKYCAIQWNVGRALRCSPFRRKSTSAFKLLNSNLYTVASLTYAAAGWFHPYSPGSCNLQNENSNHPFQGKLQVELFNAHTQSNKSRNSGKFMRDFHTLI